jgi:signal transduction histidine kinase
MGQILTAVNINLHAAKGFAPEVRRILDESTALVDRAIQQVRDMSLELRPSMLDDLGLDAALRWYTDRQATRTGLKIQLSIHSQKRLPPELETACFRIVQEALNNTVRQARAKHVWITFDQRGGLVELVIQDDGPGIGVELESLGLDERVRALGGQIDIESTQLDGTEIRARIPIGELVREEAL